MSFNVFQTFFRSISWPPISNQGLLLWRMQLRGQPLNLLSINAAVRYSFTFHMVSFSKSEIHSPFFPWFLFPDLTW
ncbi:hypothetical protein AAZX31_16G057900 [Glycine max]